MKYLLSMLLLSASALQGCKTSHPTSAVEQAPTAASASAAANVKTGANGYPYCTNGSNTGNGYGWDPSVTDPHGSHSCLVPSQSIGANGYPYCTNGSNTGNGFGWDPSVTDPHGTHSCLVPTASMATNSSLQTNGLPDASAALPALNVGAAGNSAYHISDYGSVLQTNKNILAAAADAAGATAEEKAIVIAMAMQETTLMEVSQGDRAKDGTAAANCSVLNLNYDMLQKVGYNKGDYGTSLNDPNNMAQAVGYLLKAFHMWGIQSTLNYQRGGATAFSDGYSYGAADYRNAITTIYNRIAADRSLESDSRRVEVSVQGV